MTEEMPEKEKLLDLEAAHHKTSLPPQLQEFEVEYDTRPPFRTRFRQAIQPGRRTTKWVIAAVCLDLICAGYQAVDSYSDIYPGSELAAHILRNTSTWGAWFAFYWIFTIFACICNVSLLFTDQWKWFWRLSEKLKFGWLIRVWRMVLVLVVIGLIFGPIWVTYLIRGLWSNSVWNSACSGWDITAVIQAVSYYQWASHPSVIATATISAAQGSFIMKLMPQNFDNNYEQYTVRAFSNVNQPGFNPAFANISYNTISHAYNGSNITASYVTSPNLAFPALDLELRDPSIPFTRPNMNTYPPSADLIYRNGSTEANVLQTVMTSPTTCTTLKVCGTQNYLKDFQIALGVVMIEQFKVGVLCSVPSDTASPNL